MRARKKAEVKSHLSLGRYLLIILSESALIIIVPP
jgi:hypothetical protein